MKQPVKHARRALRKTESTLPVVVEPAAGGSPFLSFRYSFTEISATGSVAKLRAKQARYEEGRLTSSEFEGELDRGVYERAVRDARQHLLGPWQLFLRSFSSLLP